MSDLNGTEVESGRFTDEQLEHENAKERTEDWGGLSGRLLFPLSTKERRGANL